MPISTKDHNAKPLYPIASVDNALRLLLMFRDQRELRLSEAAGALGVVNSTAHRLLAMLVQHQFVVRDHTTKGYVAGPALYDVGLAVVRRLDVRNVIRPFLEEVAEETGETVHCGLLDEALVRYIDGIESPKALRVAGRTGMTLPAHCSSVGKAILAQLSTEDLHSRYPSSVLPQSTDRSIATREDLERVLQGVRQQGYGVNREESEEGVVAVGVAIPAAARSVLSGISCAAPVSRMGAARVRQLGAYLVEVAKRAGEVLAHPVGPV